MKRKIALLSAFVFLFSIVAIFEYAQSTEWNTGLTIGIFVCILAFLVSYIFSYLRSGAWKFTHKTIKDMDEREVQVCTHSLRIAYSVFSIILLAVLLIFALFELTVSMVFVASLILSAHMLPVCINAWKAEF